MLKNSPAKILRSKTLSGQDKIKGFTLIELLVVVAIIGILASVVFVSVKSVKQKAKRAAALWSFSQIRLAMDMYWEGNYCNGAPDCSYSPSVPPPFFPNWNASYYCATCGYYLSVFDSEEYINGDWVYDGKAGCGYVMIYGGNPFIYIYKYILCDDCPDNCGILIYN